MTEIIRKIELRNDRVQQVELPAGAEIINAMFINTTYTTPVIFVKMEYDMPIGDSRTIIIAKDEQAIPENTTEVVQLKYIASGFNCDGEMCHMFEEVPLGIVKDFKLSCTRTLLKIPSTAKILDVIIKHNDALDEDFVYLRVLLNINQPAVFRIFYVYRAGMPLPFKQFKQIAVLPPDHIIYEVTYE
ncbi:MAG: hypothetical protein WC346_05105 [Methanogenium sp.]|jgi:hypothetical protein